MSRRKNIPNNALLVGAFFLLPIQLLSQGGGLELLPGADYIEGDNGRGFHRLIGNVSFKYQSNTMYCDSAHFYDKQKVVLAYGHVHINKKDTLNLFCDSLYYSGQKRKAKLWGNVRMRDKEYRLTTDTLEYDAVSNQAFYHHGGNVENSLTGERLTSRVGYFYPESKNVFFSHDVNYSGKGLNMNTDTLQYVYNKSTAYFHGATTIQMDGSNMYCESGWYNTETEEGSLQRNAWIARENEYIAGDTLIYHAQFGEYEGIGNVYYIDSVQQMEFRGDYAYHSDSLHYSVITGNALASKSNDTDTLFLHADTLYSYRDDSTELFKAYRGAMLYSRHFQGKADSITYCKDSNRIEFYTDPIFWTKGSELKGQFVEVILKEDSIIHRVHVHDRASALMEVVKDTLYNQVGGNAITAFFNDNDLYQIDANGNAMTVLFPEDEEVNDSTVVKKRLGMNRLYSSDLRIYLDSNEVTGITYLQEPDGVFYPMDRIKKDEQFIPGFEWLDALRPRSVEEMMVGERIDPEKVVFEPEENE